MHDIVAAYLLRHTKQLSIWLTFDNRSRLAVFLQVLRHQHGLSEPDTQRLYRALHIYSLGFQQVVADITARAHNRQQLLPSIWKAFSQLWEEALQVCFARLSLISGSLCSWTSAMIEASANA